MNTQYEKNSRYIAASCYRCRQRKNKLLSELVVFFSVLSIVCTVIYIIISSIS